MVVVLQADALVSAWSLESFSMRSHERAALSDGRGTIAATVSLLDTG